jgi:hypothetical protein
MQLPLQITFRNMAQSDPIEAQIRAGRCRYIVRRRHG